MQKGSVGLDEYLASLLRGEACAADSLAANDAERLLSAAREHDVVALVADRLAVVDQSSATLRRAFREESQRLAASDLAAEIELRRLLNALDAHGVQALVIKGSHLAYSHYTRPDLRARIDSDVLVGRTERDSATRVLGGLGYVPDAKPSGELTATQQLHALTRHGADVHLVDLHWRLASPQVFAHVLGFDELLSTSQPIPSLTPRARGPSNVHALLIACMHQVAHHNDEPHKLKWTYDVHVVASRLDAREWDSFLTIAAERGVAAVCREGLAQAVRWLHTQVPASVLTDARLVSHGPERTAEYLRPRAQARVVLDDLRALATWSERSRLVREHLFPSRDYMRSVYAPSSRMPLPAMYVLRALRGARRWLRRGAVDTH